MCLCHFLLVILVTCSLCQLTYGSHPDHEKPRPGGTVKCHLCRGLKCDTGDCQGTYCFTGRSPLPAAAHRRHQKNGGESVIKGCLTGHIPGFPSLLKSQFHLCSHDYCNKSPTTENRSKSHHKQHHKKLLPDKISCSKQETENFDEIVEEERNDQEHDFKAESIKRKRFENVDGKFIEDKKAEEEVEAVFGIETESAETCHGEVCWEKATLDEKSKSTKHSQESELLLVSSLRAGCSNFNPGLLGGISPSTEHKKPSHYCVSPPIGNFLITTSPLKYDKSSIACYCADAKCNNDGQLADSELLKSKPLMHLSTTYHLPNGLKVSGPKGKVMASPHTDIHEPVHSEGAEGEEVVTIHGPSFKVEIRVALTEAGEEHIKHRKHLKEENLKNHANKEGKHSKSESFEDMPQSDKAGSTEPESDQSHKDSKHHKQSKVEGEEEENKSGISEEGEENKGRIPHKETLPEGPRAPLVPISSDVTLVDIPKKEDLEKQKAFEKMDERDNKIIIAVFGALISVILFAGLAWKCDFVGRIRRKRYENVDDGVTTSLQ